MEREHPQVVRRLEDAGEVADDRRVIEIAALRNHRHRQMLFDQDAQRVRGGTIEVQALGDAQRDLGADIGVITGVQRLAGVVQQ